MKTAYLVTVRCRKNICGSQTEVSSTFFHEAVYLEEVLEYVQEHFKDVAFLYVETLPPSTDIEEL